jgi:type I restriction enzyme S subunit
VVDGGKIASTARTLTRDGLSSGSTAVPPGSIVLSTRAPIGYVAETTSETAFNQGCRGLVPRVELDLRYFRYQLLARRGDLVALGQGSTFGELSSDALAAFKVSCPPLSEQRRNSDFLDVETVRIDALIEKKRRMLDLLDARWATRVRNRLNALGGVMPLKRRWRVIDCKHRTPIYVEDGYPVTSPGDISAGRIDLSACHRFVDDDDFADLTEGRKPKRGDIIYSRNASAGIAAYVDTDEAFCMGQDVCLITSRDQDQRYLMYVLNSLGVDQLLPIKVGSTITRINVDQIGELEIPTPPVEVQGNVADALDLERERLDILVARIRRQMDLLSEHRQALITAAVTGQLNVGQVAV